MLDTYGPPIFCIVVSSIMLLMDLMSDIPRLDKVYRCEDCPKDNANASNGHICNTQERVLASHHSPSRYDQGFRASVFSDNKVCSL